MHSNWALSPNTSATTSKSQLVRTSPVVEFDDSKHGSAPITRATRCEREKSKQQSTCFMENHLLHQLRQLFSKICDEHKNLGEAMTTWKCSGHTYIRWNHTSPMS